MAFEWAFITLFWVVLSMKYYIRSTMAELEASAPFSADTHYPMYAAGAASLVENNMLAFLALLAYMKVFKYIGHLPLVRRIFAASQAAFNEMFAFLAVRSQALTHTLCCCVSERAAFEL